MNSILTCFKNVGTVVYLLFFGLYKSIFICFLVCSILIETFLVICALLLMFQGKVTL